MRFRNLPGTLPQTAGPSEFVPFFLRRAFDRTPPAIPPAHVVPRSEAKEMLRNAGSESLTWLGHAAFLLRSGGRSLLTDPFLSERASPVSMAGPKRFVPPGLEVGDLPPVDVLVLSHDHYDHLDAKTIDSLPGKERMVVAAPRGLGPFFRKRGYRDVRELAWWEETRVANDFVLACLPANHFSGRTPFDRNSTLWASWAIASRTRKIFFAGDTGYGPVFAEIGKTSGPFDTALVPIGAYEPSSIMRPVHCDPEEAIAVGRDVRATTLVAMHWGTIVLTDEPPFEPPGRFRAAASRAGIPDSDVWVMRIGETRITSANRKA